MGMMTGVSLEAEEILRYLKTEMRFKEIYQKVLCRQIVLQTAQERGVAVSPTDVQEEADRLRRELRLEKAADTLAWLAEQMITPEEWDKRAGIVSLQKEGQDIAAVSKMLLDDHKIVIAARRGFLRVSPHFYNSEDEIERLVAALP